MINLWRSTIPTIFAGYGMAKQTASSYKIEGVGPREEIWEIPLTVFKEAIINALSHRDYYGTGATITTEMFDDRVEVS